MSTQIGWLERALWWAVYGAEWLLVIHLWRVGLARRYPSFFAYLVLLVATDSVLVWLDPATTLYGGVYLASVIPLAVLSLVAVLEIYKLALQPYAGIYSLSRWVLTAAVAGSFLLAALTVWVDFQGPPEPYPILLLFNAFVRAFSLALLLLLLLINGFLWFMPVKTNRNTVTHTWVFFLHFGVRTVTHLSRNLLGPESLHWASPLLLCVDLVCMLWWRWRLSPEGETLPRPPSYHWDPETAQRLLRQLEQINAQLSRGWWK